RMGKKTFRRVGVGGVKMKTYCCPCHNYNGKQMDCCSPRYVCERHRTSTLDQWEADSIKALTAQSYSDLSFLALDARILHLIDLIRKKEKMLGKYRESLKDY